MTKPPAESLDAIVKLINDTETPQLRFIDVQAQDGDATAPNEFTFLQGGSAASRTRLDFESFDVALRPTDVANRVVELISKGVQPVCSARVNLTTGAAGAIIFRMAGAHGEPDADGFTFTKASVFGLNMDGTPDAQDNGRGAWGDVTTDPHLIGAAIPISIAIAHFGSTAAASHQMVEVINRSNNLRILAPIVDLGPLEGTPDSPVSKGVALDLTLAAQRALGGNGMIDVKYRFVSTSAQPQALADGLPAQPAADALPAKPKTNGVDQIVAIAAKSAIAKYPWNDRGAAFIGYIKGMAVTYARLYAGLKTGDRLAIAIARANTGRTETDALAFYNDIFKPAGLDNSKDGADTLRHVFVLLTGLGMRETSGRYCEGWDWSKEHPKNPADFIKNTEDNAEAGLFQVSHDILHVADTGLGDVIARYTGATPPAGYKEIFMEKVTPAAGKKKTDPSVGNGAGFAFQEQMKNLPALAVEFAALGLRKIRKEWGPINRQEAEVKATCDAMLKDVQNAVDAGNLTFP